MKQRMLFLLLVLATQRLFAVPMDSIAVNAVNALGIDLLHQTARPGANALLSPYSIQLAMVMTCAGADGQTRDEMIRVLHYPKDEEQMNRSFADLQASVNGIMGRDSVTAQQDFEKYKEYIDNNAPPGPDGEKYRSLYLPYLNNITNSVLTLTTVNRLYGQSGYDIRPAHLKLLKDNWQASFESVDFEHNPSGITKQINSWLRDQTHGRIQNLIPASTLDEYTRLVLVNAIYLKAPWLQSFSDERTQPAAFHLSDGTVIQVPTMFQPPRDSFMMGYAQRGGYWGLLGSSYTILAIPYNCPELQFVILMPDRGNGLPALEAGLTPEILAGCTNLPSREVDLSLPKFKVEPPALSLVEALRALGIKSAFEKDANFNRTAVLRPGEGLYISDIFHKTFLQLDETGTEASAGTVVKAATFGPADRGPLAASVMAS